MSLYLSKDTAFTNTANAIRSKLGTALPLTWDTDDGFADDVGRITPAIDFGGTEIPLHKTIHAYASSDNNIYADPSIYSYVFDVSGYSASTHMVLVVHQNRNATNYTINRRRVTGANIDTTGSYTRWNYQYDSYTGDFIYDFRLQNPSTYRYIWVQPAGGTSTALPVDGYIAKLYKVT